MADKTLPPELQAKLAKWEQNAAKANASKTAPDVVASFQAAAQLLTTASTLLGERDARAEKLAALLEEMVKRADKAMATLKPIDIPDNSAPIIEALAELRTAINKANTRPPVQLPAFPAIPTPQVTVDAPPIDTSKIEQALREDIPKAFQDAIALIRVEAPGADLSPVADQLGTLRELLEDISVGVRLKPQPGTIKVTNPDGTPIAAGGGSFNPGTSYDYIDAQQTSGTVETYVYKLGGSAGTVVRTIVVTYTSTAKSDIDTVEYS